MQQTAGRFPNATCKVIDSRMLTGVQPDCGAEGEPCVCALGSEGAEPCLPSSLSVCNRNNSKLTSKHW